MNTTENQEVNLDAYSTYSFIFIRIFGRLILGDSKEVIMKAVEAKEEQATLPSEINMPETMFLSQVLTTKALALLTIVQSMNDEPLQESLAKVMVYLEKKDLILPTKIHAAIYPDGFRGKQLFDPEDKKLNELWGEDNFIELFKILSFFVKEKAEKNDPLSRIKNSLSGISRMSDMSDLLDKIHDCDNCQIKGDCEIEGIVRELKTKKSQPSPEEILSIVTPKSNRDIN